MASSSSLRELHPLPVVGVHRLEHHHLAEPERSYHHAMPTNAYALFLTFATMAVVIGCVTAWVVGPRRRAAAVVPVLGAFLAMYVIGHRGGIHAGPSVDLFGYQVTLFFDVGVAVLGATIAAVAQCLLVGRRNRGSAA